MRLFDQLKAAADALLSTKKKHSKEIWVMPRWNHQNPDPELDVLDVWECDPKTNTKEKLGVISHSNFEKQFPKISLVMAKVDAPAWNIQGQIQFIKNWGERR